MAVATPSNLLSQPERSRPLPVRQRRGVTSSPRLPNRRKVSSLGSLDSSFMTDSSTTRTGDTHTSKRYRTAGIQREGIAQLSLLETALWPLQGGRLPSNTFETRYSYETAAGRKHASVTVRAPS